MKLGIISVFFCLMYCVRSSEVLCDEQEKCVKQFSKDAESVPMGDKEAACRVVEAFMECLEPCEVDKEKAYKELEQRFGVKCGSVTATINRSLFLLTLLPVLKKFF